MKAALKRGVETGTLVMVKSSYKVSAEAKKPVKAKTPTAAKVKKPVTKVILYLFLSSFIAVTSYHSVYLISNMFPNT